MDKGNWWDQYKTGDISEAEEPQGLDQSAIEGVATKQEDTPTVGNWWDEYAVTAPAADNEDTEKTLLSNWDSTTQQFEELRSGYEGLGSRYEELSAMESRTPEQEKDLQDTWNKYIRSGLEVQSALKKVETIQPEVESFNNRQKQKRVDYIESQRGSAVFGNEVADSLYEIDARANLDYEKAREIPDKDKRKEAFAKIRAGYQTEETQLLQSHIDAFKENETKIGNAAEVIGQAFSTQGGDRSSQTVDQFLLETSADVEEYAELRDSLLNQDDPEKGKLFREASLMNKLAEGGVSTGVVNGEVRISPSAVWNAELVKQEIAELDVSDAQKQLAIASIPRMQEEAAKLELPFLQKVNEFNAFVKKNNLQGDSPKDQISEWKSRTRNWSEMITKAPAQVGIGLTQGALGLLEAGQAIIGGTAMTMGAQKFADPFLDAATQTSERNQELGRISQEIGGPTLLAELAAVAPQIALQIGIGKTVSFGGTKLGLKPKMVSNLGFGSSVGTAMAQSYGNVLSSAFQQLEKEKIDAGMDPIQARAEAVKEAQLPAALSGLSTAIVTAVGGKRGVESPFNEGVDSIKAKLNTAAFRAELPRLIPDVIKGMRNEGYEELADQLAQGIIEQFTFNPELKTSDIINNAVKALVIGGITGGTVEGLKYGFDYMRAPKEMARREASMASIRQSITDVEKDISAASASSPIGGEFQREYDATLPSDEAAKLGAIAVDRTKMSSLQAERQELAELLEDETISKVARNQLEGKLAAADVAYYNEVLAPMRRNVVNEQLVDQLDGMVVSQQTKDSIVALSKIANGLGAESLTGRERVAVGITSIGEGKFLSSKKNPMVEVGKDGRATVTEAGRLMAENVGMVPLVRMIGLSESTRAKQAEMERIVNELEAKKAQQGAKDTAESEDAKRYGPASAEALKQQVAAQPTVPETQSNARLAQLLKEQEEAARKALEAVKKPETPPVEEPPVAPELEPLRRVTRAEQTPEDVAALTETGLIEIYKDQPVLTQAGIDALPEAERPRLNPEARKIQIDTGSNEVVAEAISKGLRIGVDQVGPNVTMPQGWTLDGDIYIPPAPVTEPPVAPPVTPPVEEPPVTPPTEPPVTPPVTPPPVAPTAGAITEEQANNVVKTAQEERAKKNAPTIGKSRWGPQSVPPKAIIGGTAREALITASRLNLSKISQSNPNEILMQDVAAILAELKMPILDLESVASLSSLRAKGRPRRWPGIGSVIGMPSTTAMPVEILVHELGHTLTADQIRRYLPRKKTGNGKAYLDALNKAIADPNTPEAVSRLFSLYVSAIDQLGITEQYFGAKGVAGTPKADTSKAMAKRLQAKGLLRKDLKGSDLYGLANVEEFVSQTFSEPSFRNVLKGLKDPTNPTQSLWQAFVDAIQVILQLPKGSMAAGVIETSIDVGMTVPSDRALGQGRTGTAPSPAPRPSLITPEEADMAPEAEPDLQSVLEGKTTKTVRMGMVMDNESVLELFGRRMYSAALPNVVVKETSQNAFDAIKDAEETGEMPRGGGVISHTRSDVEVDGERKIREMFIDNGAGMTPETLQKAFFTVGGTFKRSGKGSGGFGIAKIGMFMSADRVMVETVRDGVVTVADLNRTQLLNREEGFDVTVTNDPTRKNGTMVILEFPKEITGEDGRKMRYEDAKIDSDLILHNITIIDDSTGNGYSENTLMNEFRGIKNNFTTFEEIKGRYSRPVFTFDDYVRSTPNAEVFEKEFPISGAVKPIKVRIAAFRMGQKNKNGQRKYSSNIEINNSNFNFGNAEMSVYSNGLFQFKQSSLKINPLDFSSERLPYNIIVEIDAGGVDAKSLSYPFKNNREDFQDGIVKAYVSQTLTDIRINEKNRQFDQEFGILTDIDGGVAVKGSPVLYNNTKMDVAPEEQEFLKDLSRGVFDAADDIVLALRKGYEDRILDDDWYKAKSPKGTAPVIGRTNEDSLDYFYGVGISKNWGGVNTSKEPVSALVNPLYEEKVDEYAKTEFGRRMLARLIVKTLIHEINHHLHRSEGSDFTYFLLQNESYLGELGVIQNAVDLILPIVNKHSDAIISLKGKFRTTETKDADNELTGEQYERSSEEADGQPRGTAVGDYGVTQQSPTEVSPRPTSEENGEQTGAYLPSSITAGGKKDTGIGEGISFGEALSKALVENQAQTTEGGVSLAQQDSDHLTAVESGDTKTAQRLTDEIAAVRNYQSQNLLFHGTTHIFNVFRKDRTNVENDFGKGYYLTNTEADAQINYAGEGPDLTSRIERLSEQLQDNDNLDEAEARKKATEILSGGGQRIMRVYVRLENPFNVGGANETFLDYDLPYNETTEEYGEPTGKLAEFLQSLRYVVEGYAEDSPVDADKAVANIIEYAMDRDGISASDLVRLLKQEDSGIMYASDENGDSATSEIIRQAIEEAGFDGVVDNLVNQKFGGAKKIGRAMAGMGPDTVHTIVFDSSQIKSADAATYDDDGNLIPLSRRFLAEEEDVRFSPEEEFDIVPEQVEDQIEGTPEAAAIKVMGQAFQMANEQSAAAGTPQGTIPLETITSAWMNSGRDVETLENAIIRYTNLNPEVAATLAEAISQQVEIQRGITEIADAARSRKAEQDEEPEIKPYSFAERIRGELPPILKNKIQLVYEVLRNEVSVQEANQAMSGLTVDEAIRATEDEKNGIRMPVRSMMAQIVLRKIMAQRRATKGKKGKEADYEAAVEAHVNFFNWTSEYFKELGQGVQAIARFSDLGADGVLLKVKKSIEKATQKHITNRRGQIDKIKRDVEEADSAAFKAALNANKDSMDATADKAGKQEAKIVTIEEQAQKLAQRAAKKVAGEEIRRRQPDPLSELVNGHLRRYNANFVTEATAMGVSPVTAQAIEDSAIKLRDSRKSAKAERERFKDMQDERMKVKKELARENKYIYGPRQTIWENYQDMFSDRLARRLMRDPKKKIPPSLLLFTDRLTENLLGFIPEAERQATTQRSFQAMIEDALNNKEKYQEAFKRALEDVSFKVMELEVREANGEKISSSTYKKALAAQEFMERLEPIIQQFPVSDKLIIRFVNQKTKAIGESITAKYNQWYRSSKKTRSEIEMELAQKLVEDINVSDSDAIKLSRAIIKDFRAKAEERREKALARFKKPKEKSKRLKESPLKKFFELVNIGAMTDKDAYEVMAHRFELPTWDAKFAKQIEDMALIVQDMPEGLERRRLTRNMMAEIARRKGFSLSDLGAGFAYSNMLSSVQTFLINLQDTLFNNWFNGLASAAADGDFSRMNGLLAGYRKGWQEAIQVFQTGLRINMPRLEEKTPLTVELINYGKKGGVALESNEGMNAIAKTLLESPIAWPLNAWKIVTRIMEATDALNYVASSEGQRYAEAAKMAKDEGLEGKEKTKRINQILNLGDDVYQAALKQAESEGYTGIDLKFRAMEIQDSKIDADLREKSFDRALVDVYRNMPTGLAGFFAAKFNGLVMAFPNAFIRNAFKILIAPFVITPTNVFNKWLDWSPYGYKRLFLGSGNLTDKDGPYYVAPPKVGSAEFWAQTYKASSSVLIFLMAEGLIRAGLLVINGMGPSDEEERKQWLADGNRPHTFSFMGGPQISYQYTPWALVLSWRANYDNWVKYQAKEDASLVDRGLVGLLSATSVIMDLPFFAGPADFLGFVQSKTSGDVSSSVSKYVEGKMGAVFPNFIRHIDQIFDPTIYDSRGIKGIILDQTPWARRLGTQRVNLFGEPIGEDKPTMDRLIGRIISSPVNPSRESRILAKYDIYPYMPNPKQAKALVDGVEAQMTEEQYNKFVKIVGSQVKQDINGLFDPEGEVSETEMELGKKRISEIFKRARARGVREVSTY